MRKYEYRYSAFGQMREKKAAEKKTSKSNTPYKFLMYVTERK